MRVAIPAGVGMLTTALATRWASTSAASPGAETRRLWHWTRIGETFATAGSATLAAAAGTGGDGRLTRRAAASMAGPG
jgi:hypothetical protein